MPRLTRYILRGPAWTVLLSLLLASCSVVNGTVTSPPPVPSGARSGGVLKVGITAPGGIDPADAYEPVGQLISQTMCDTLVVLDPTTGQLREGLAQSWVLSADGTTITFKPRHGLTFTDGRHLGSKDLNVSLQELVSPANASYVRALADPFTQPTTSAAINPTDILADSPGKAADVAQAINDYDVQLRSKVQDGGIIRSFADPAMAPISHLAYAADAVKFAADPVCVGPYRLAQPYVSGASNIRLVRYKGYYGKNVGYTGGGVGYPDEIDFTIFPSAAAAVTAYLKGTVDVVSVPRDQMARASADAASLVYGPATAVEYLGLPDGIDGPLNDPDVRIALSMALDRRRLAQLVFGPAALPATGFEPPALAISAGPSVDGRKVKSAPLSGCGPLTPATADLTGARARLAVAEAKPGAKRLDNGAITLTVNNDSPYPQLAAEIAAEWKAGLGLHVHVVTVPWNDYLSKATEGAGLDTAFRIRWSSDAAAPVKTFNDQQSFLQPLLSSGATTAGNWAHWTERSFDYGLTQDAGTVADVQLRGIAFAKLSQIVCDKMPMLPLVFDRPVYLVRSTALGSARLDPVGRDGLLLLRELFLK
jgi:ABC-type transport system substrate-binding protein